MSDQSTLTRKHHALALAAAIPFLVSLAVAGYALNSGIFLGFGLAWPLLQVFGYVMTLRTAQGDIAHPLVTTQIILHYIVLTLLIAVIGKAL